MFIENESSKDFSKLHDIPKAEGDQPINIVKKIEEMSIEERKKSKSKVVDQLEWISHPYSFLDENGTLTCINTIDCIQIYLKMEQLKPEEDAIVISIIHSVTIDLKNMTVTMLNNPKKTFTLIRAESYKDHVRPKQSLKADASSMDIRGKWPKTIGAFARLWGKTVKGDANAHPSLREVVMGICLHHIESVEPKFKELESDPD